MGRENVFARVNRLLELAVRHFKEDNPEPLPPEVAGIFERWTMAYQLKTKWNHRGYDFVLTTYKIWLKNVHGIENHKTALEDMYAAPMIGWIINPINRHFHRELAIMRLEKQISAAYANKEWGDAARLETVLQKHLDPKHDPLPPDENDEIMKTFAIEPVFEPELLGLENQSFDIIYSKRDAMKSKLDKLLKDAEDLEPIEREVNEDEIERD